MIIKCKFKDYYIAKIEDYRLAALTIYLDSSKFSEEIKLDYSIIVYYLNSDILY